MKRVWNNISKYALYIFTIGIFLVAIYFFMGEKFLPREQKRFDHQCEVYNGKWEQVLLDGTTKEIELPVTLQPDGSGQTVIQTILPNDINQSAYMRFRSQRQDMRFYIEDEFRSEYSTKQTRLWGSTSPVSYVFFEIREEDAGKKLTVVIESLDNYVGILHTVYYGDYYGMWQYEISENGVQLVVSFLLMVISFVAILVSIVLMVYLKRVLQLVYLSAAVFACSVWLIFNSVFRQLLALNISVINDMPFFMLLLMPIPFLAYMNEVQNHRYYKCYIFLEGVAAIDFLVCSFFQIIDYKDFAQMFFVMAGILILTILLIFVTMGIDIKTGDIKKYVYTASGFFVAGILGCMQIMIYLEVQKPFDTSAVVFGFVFLLFVAAINTIREVMHLQEEKQSALLANQMKSQFLANMSHEIRTPISAVLGLNEMIIRESSEEAIVSYAEDVRDSGKMLLSLINDILDLSKIESGKMELVYVEYYVSQMLGMLNNVVKTKVEEKNLQLNIDFDPDLPSVLYGDDKRIQQVLINVLNNAVKYTQKGHIDFKAGFTKLDEQHIELRFSIKDTGIGIKEEDKNKLFEAFSRIEEEKNRNIEGTGLGLAITKRIIDLMGGTIEVQSTYGEGSEFVIRIRQEVRNMEPMGEIKEHTIATQLQEDKLEEFYAPSARILVVDDLVVNLKVFQGLLKETKVKIDAVESGRRALDKWSHNPYHIVFLDHMMPEMDGIECRREMIKPENNMHNENTPVIMLTANAIKGSREQYIKEGFADYLSKPFERNDLIRMLLQYLPEELIEKKKKKVVRLDQEAGLLNCAGNEKLYHEVLETFAEAQDTYRLEKIFQERRWEEYRELIGELKNNAITIGGIQLVRRAEELERDLGENSIQVVAERHRYFMEEYEKLVKEINAMRY